MLAYIVRRLLLIIPTLFGIILLNFAIVQFAPGGPVEQMIAQIQGTAVDATSRVAGGLGDGGQKASTGWAAIQPRALNPSIAAPAACHRNSSPNWNSSSASTSRPMSGSF